MKCFIFADGFSLIFLITAWRIPGIFNLEKINVTITIIVKINIIVEGFLISLNIINIDEMVREIIHSITYRKYSLVEENRCPIIPKLRCTCKINIINIKPIFIHEDIWINNNIIYFLILIFVNNINIIICKGISI